MNLRMIWCSLMRRWWVGVLCLSIGLGFVFLDRASAQLPILPFGWGPMPLAAVPARVTALIANPGNTSTVYLASPGGVWRTDDNGLDWRPLFDSIYPAQACSVAFDPSNPNVLYAGTGDSQAPRPDQGVARSQDSGQTWSIGNRFTNQPVCTLAVDPSNGARVLAGSSEGLFLSLDSSNSFQKVLLYPPTSVAFDGQGNIYAGALGPDTAGTRNFALYRSSDGGMTWTNFSLPLPPNLVNTVTDWVNVLARGNTLYLAISYHANQVPAPADLVDFYISTDGGATWTISPAITSAVPPIQILADSSAQNLYLAAGSLMTSPDQGHTWTSLTTTTAQFHAAALTGGSLLMGGEQGLELSALNTGGPSGVLAPAGLGRLLSIAFDPSNEQWVGGPNGIFDLHQPGLNGVSVGSIGVPATGASLNIMGSGSGNVYYSTNGGSTFSTAAVIPSRQSQAPDPPMLLSSTSPSTAYVAGNQLYKTTDSGAVWTSVSTIDPNPSNFVVALASAPTSSSILYAATACLPEITQGACSNASNIWKSTNSGTSWTLEGEVLGIVDRLAVDPRQTGYVYAAVGGFPGGPSTTAGYSTGNLMLSTTSGSTWTSVLANLPAGPVNAIVIDPTSVPATTITPPSPGNPFPTITVQQAQTIYVGTDTGVYVTFNAGQQWTQINSGLPPVPVTYLSLQQPGAALEAATYGRSAFQASVANLSPGLILNPLGLNVSLNQGASKTVLLSLANISTTTSLNWQMTPMDSWISAPAASGTLQPSGTATATFQVSTAGLALGTFLGRMQVTGGTSSQSQTLFITLHVTTPPASMSIVSGNNATGAPGTTLPPFIVSLTDANGAPVSGAQVNFAVTSGGGTLSTQSIMTSATGTAQTALTLPSSPGTVQVVATSGTLSATFTASAVLVIPPSLLANSVVNGVTFNSTTPPGPGTIISIFGTNLAASAATAAALPLPTSLQNTQVELVTPVGNVDLPLFFVSPRQVNTLLPYDLTAGTYTLSVVSNGVASNTISLAVAAYSPGIFTVNSSGQGQGIFVQSDGSMVTASNPAAAGSAISIYATGLGAVNPPLAAGAAAASVEPLNRTVQTPHVYFDTYEATVLYSGLAPGFAGLYQVNVQVPMQISSAANIPVTLSIGGITSNSVSIATQAAPAAPLPVIAPPKVTTPSTPPTGSSPTPTPTPTPSPSPSPFPSLPPGVTFPLPGSGSPLPSPPPGFTPPSGGGGTFTPPSGGGGGAGGGGGFGGGGGGG